MITNRLWYLNVKVAPLRIANIVSQLPNYIIKFILRTGETVLVRCHPNFVYARVALGYCVRGVNNSRRSVVPAESLKNHDFSDLRWDWTIIFFEKRSWHVVNEHFRRKLSFNIAQRWKGLASAGTSDVKSSELHDLPRVWFRYDVKQRVNSHKIQRQICSIQHRLHDETGMHGRHTFNLWNLF